MTQVKSPVTYAISYLGEENDKTPTVLYAFCQGNCSWESDF